MYEYVPFANRHPGRRATTSPLVVRVMKILEMFNAPRASVLAVVVVSPPGCENQFVAYCTHQTSQSSASLYVYAACGSAVRRLSRRSSRPFRCPCSHQHQPSAELLFFLCSLPVSCALHPFVTPLLKKLAKPAGNLNFPFLPPLCLLLL